MSWWRRFRRGQRPPESTPGEGEPGDDAVAEESVDGVDGSTPPEVEADDGVSGPRASGPGVADDSAEHWRAGDGAKRAATADAAADHEVAEGGVAGDWAADDLVARPGADDAVVVEPGSGRSADDAGQTAAVRAELATIAAEDVERVLHRAIELADESVVVAERFPQTTVEEVAAELQLPVSAVADALAEYRAGGLPSVAGARWMEERRTVVDRLVGPRHVKVRHRTGLPEEATLVRLGEWLKRYHRLRIRTTDEGIVVGVRRRGVVPVALRSMRSATGRAGLSGLREVRGAVVAVDGGGTSFCVVADVSEQRTRSVIAGSAVAIGGAAVVSTAAVVTAPVTLVGVPVAVGAGWVTSRLTHRYRVRQVAEEVEITADEVAAGAEPPTLVRELGERLYPRR